MADVILNHIYKVYPNGVKAVSDFSINIKDKEFIVFVGPSGCGKSTTLRMIAGLEDITAGDLYIGGRLVNDVQPKDRDIAMVFQNYALYPHMNVYENIAFSLRNQHMPKDEINKKVMAAAKILGIEEYLDRKPKAMSGGQRQRVSLGRAIVRDPKVFLLDEPLSNLDAKLRAQMRGEITKLYKKLATTFIYVTHDQIEAMTMGTRIVVMKNGFAQQIDTPTNLYDHPINKFVAGFIGTPQMNFFDVVLTKDGSNVKILFEDKQMMVIPYADFIKCDPFYLDGKTHVSMGIRPNNILIQEKKSSSTIDMIITSIEKLGDETLLYCDLGDIVTTDESVTKSSFIIKIAPNDSHTSGEKIHVAFCNSFIKIFENEKEQSIMPFFPTYSRASVKFDSTGMTLFGKTVKIPSAFKSLKEGTHLISVPNASVIDGHDFVLPCYNCEEAGENQFLVTLKDEGGATYLFTTSPIEVKKGDLVNFSIAFEDVSFSDVANFMPVKHEVEVIGRFTKVKEINHITNKREIVFYAAVGQAMYRLSTEFVRRFINIEGRRALQIEYRLRFTPKLIADKTNAIEHICNRISDYGAKQYMNVTAGKLDSDIDITSAYKDGLEDTQFTFDQTRPLAVYTLAADVKII